jgi:hypothetical protein
MAVLCRTFGEIQRVGANPTLLLSSDFPLTVSDDGTLYFPDLGRDQRVKIIRLTPSGSRSVLATLPAVSDSGPLRWLNGIAAAPDGSIYYTENAAVRRITVQGTISTIASKIVVPDCVSIPGGGPKFGPLLRGLDVATNGTIYVAASGCGAVLRITAHGEVTPILRTTSPWSPTGVAVSRDDVYVLEYLHTVAEDRRAWIPRVRRLSSDGASVIVATVERSGSGGANQPPARADSFLGLKAGDEREVRGVKLCWCPPGKFRMGSPRGEPERRPGEDQVEVTLSRGFWMGNSRSRKVSGNKSSENFRAN